MTQCIAMLQLSGANRGTRVVRAPDVEGGDPVPERLEGPHMAGQHLYHDGNDGNNDDDPVQNFVCLTGTFEEGVRKNLSVHHIVTSKTMTGVTRMVCRD